MPFLLFRSGSFAVQFEDRLRSGIICGPGIICGLVQYRYKIGCRVCGKKKQTNKNKKENGVSPFVKTNEIFCVEAAIVPKKEETAQSTK